MLKQNSDKIGGKITCFKKYFTFCTMPNIKVVMNILFLFGNVTFNLDMTISYQILNSHFVPFKKCQSSF